MLYATICFVIAVLLLIVAFAADISTLATNVRTAYKVNAATNKGSALDLALDTISTTRQIYGSAKADLIIKKSQINSPFESPYQSHNF